MRLRMLYLMAGLCLVHSAFIPCYGQGTPSREYCRQELLRRESTLKEAKAALQVKLNRMYERMNRMKLRTTEMESGLAQIDDHLRRVGSAIVDMDK